MALFCLNVDLTKTTHYFMHIALLGSRTDSSFNDGLLVPGIHIPSLCAFYGNVLRKIFPNKR